MDIYIAVGSNVGDKEANIREAIKCLEESEGVEVDKISSLIKNKAVGGVVQPDFLNGVVKIKSNLSAGNILKITQGIESKLGRARTVKNGPRVIDLDIVLYGEETISDNDLQIPHPRMFDREFVLGPLFEIEPGLKKYIQCLRDRVNAGF
jgi:2-amino-4-hydroxy-6-hydroxymethyldihydropteridine diphosphokinase